jgi:hypothetical protein
MEKPNAPNNFQGVKQLRIDLNHIFDEIDSKLKILIQMYQELIKTHQDRNYTIGMDSFLFQNKLMQMEYDNMKDVFNFIDNRIYGEYYKLHRMLYDFIYKEIKDKSIVDKLLISHKKYPIYKDLEPTKIYDFNITTEINNTIYSAIQELKEYLALQKTDLEEHKKQINMGLNIHSIIHEQLYNNIILEERIHMFENYLDTFVSHHSKYFARLVLKVKLMLGIVNEDFQLKKHRTTTRQTTMTAKAVNLHNQFELDRLSVSSSSSSPALSTPTSCMNDCEETQVRQLVGVIDSTSELQTELNMILQHVSPIEPDEKEIYSL